MSNFYSGMQSSSELKVMYNIVLVSSVGHSEMSHLHTLQSDHHKKSTVHLSLSEVTVILILLIFPMLYFTSP